MIDKQVVIVLGGSMGRMRMVTALVAALANVVVVHESLEDIRRSPFPDLDIDSFRIDKVFAASAKGERPSSPQSFNNSSRYQAMEAHLSARHNVAARSHSGATRHQHRSRENRVAEARRNAASFKP
jgi:hypothetical protein